MTVGLREMLLLLPLNFRRDAGIRAQLNDMLLVLRLNFAVLQLNLTIRCWHDGWTAGSIAGSTADLHEMLPN